MLRIGFVGAGRMARRHFQAMKGMEGARIDAVCDPNPAALESARRILQARTYTDLDEMLTREKLDAAYVCIPIRSHGEVEEKLAEKGVHLFIEKPLALDWETVTRVRGSIARAGILSSVGYHWRYSECTDVAASEMMGRTVGMVLGSWLTGLPRQKWWTLKRENPAQIFEQTTHLFDLSRYLVGEIRQVSSIFAMRCMADVSELEDVSLVSVVFQSGAIGCMASTYMISYMHPPGRLEGWADSPNPFLRKLARGFLRMGLWQRSFDTRSFRIELMIILKDLVLQVGQASLVKTTASRQFRFRAKVDPYRRESEAFIRAVSTGDGSWIRSSYDDAARTHQVVESAIRSASLEAPVTLDF